MANQSDRQPALIVPTGDLPPLPASVWRSREISDAVEHGTPGAVVAAARRAHGLRQEEVGRLAGFSQSAISRLESGSNLAYDTRILRSLQRLLGIPPRLLGLADDTVTLRPDDTRRLVADTAPRNLATAVAEVAAVAMPTILDGAALQTLCATLAFGDNATNRFTPDRPIAPDIVTHLRVARRIINDADSSRASSALMATARRLHAFTNQLRRHATGTLRRQLLGIEALYAEFYGWLHEETGQLRPAGHWTARALQQAQAADDRDMVAYVYVRMSQLAEHDNDPDRVIGLARAALREQGDNPHVRALALQQQARGHASAGDESACLSYLDEASPLLIDITPTHSDEYQIGAWYDIEHLRLQQASCLLELSRTTEAITLYDTLRPHWGHICLWQQGVHTARLAIAHATNGDYDQAAILGQQALTLAHRSNSPLVTDELNPLRRWATVPALTELASALPQ